MNETFRKSVIETSCETEKILCNEERELALSASLATVPIDVACVLEAPFATVEERLCQHVQALYNRPPSRLGETLCLVRF